ncbi:glycosyltransferase [Desulfosporosinus metallidurans]|uniref:Glycosyltransferase n=1 Tax=Desulfosporosinus metallidurans TaxID=1888891 RepID=A0A1Q8QXS7_9FIRM|nr:glycosyltransferase [Desulfosporosinus metallidurans]OLN32162.1 Glycosyltransferase [Desulfosporosinus metallidurans]
MTNGRIIQVLPTISYGDAVSNHVLQIRDICRQSGWNTAIYAENIDPRIAEVERIGNLSRDMRRQDIIVYHMSTGSSVTELVASLPVDRKVMIYHNVTPTEYFTRYNYNMATLVSQGREQLKKVSSAFRLALADSEFNRAELEAAGFRKTGVLPLWLHDDKYESEPDAAILERYLDGRTNILFVGRIVPNKKQEDLIKSFYYYKKLFNPSARLLIVGSWNGMEEYLRDLHKFASYLELEDVVFTGHVSDSELLAYYKVAHIFLSQSEHEGFCVPLLESMRFGVPILAYSVAAIPDTLGTAGLKFSEKDYPSIAALMDIVSKRKDIYIKLIESQKERLKSFDESHITNKFWQYINSL